jgi:hypothetical protein
LSQHLLWGRMEQIQTRIGRTGDSRFAVLLDVGLAKELTFSVFLRNVLMGREDRRVVRYAPRSIGGGSIRAEIGSEVFDERDVYRESEEGYRICPG